MGIIRAGDQPNERAIKAVKLLSNREENLTIKSAWFTKNVSRAPGEVPD